MQINASRLTPAILDAVKEHPANAQSYAKQQTCGLAWAAMSAEQEVVLYHILMRNVVAHEEGVPAPNITDDELQLLLAYPFAPLVGILPLLKPLLPQQPSAVRSRSKVGGPASKQVLAAQQQPPATSSSKGGGPASKRKGKGGGAAGKQQGKGKGGPRR